MSVEPPVDFGQQVLEGMPPWWADPLAVPLWWLVMVILGGLIGYGLSLIAQAIG